MLRALTLWINLFKRDGLKKLSWRLDHIWLKLKEYLDVDMFGYAFHPEKKVDVL